MEDASRPPDVVDPDSHANVMPSKASPPASGSQSGKKNGDGVRAERVTYNRLVMHDLSPPVPAARVFLTSVKKSGLTGDQVNKLVMSSAKRKKQVKLPIYDPPRWFQVVAKIESTCSHREALDATNVISSRLLALLKGGYSVEDAYDKVVGDFPGHVQRGVLYQHKSLPLKRTITRFDRTALMWSESDDLAFSDATKRARGAEERGEPAKVDKTDADASKVALDVGEHSKVARAIGEPSKVAKNNSAKDTVVPNPFHTLPTKDKHANAPTSGFTKKGTAKGNNSMKVVPNPLHNKSPTERNAHIATTKSKATPPTNKPPKKQLSVPREETPPIASPLASPCPRTPSPPPTPPLQPSQQSFVSSEGDEGKWSDQEEEVSHYHLHDTHYK